MAIRLRRRTVLRLRLFASFALTYALFGTLWQFITDGNITPLGPALGLMFGVILALLEESNIVSFTRSMSFSSAVLVKSIIYLAFIAVPWSLAGLAAGLMDGKTLIEFVDWIFSSEFLGQIVLVYLFHLIFVFFRHLNSLLGPKTLFRYVSGKYHHPRVEKRVFMFLDLKSSTMLAETLGGEQYFSLLNTLFRDMSEPILERYAEIYQYIGDEVVLTWPADVGLRDANCIRLFIEILAEIHSRRDYYMTHFGHVPEFKAGLHYGDVITAEIGDLKKEIVYNGDVLNTTARIQSMCNQFNQRLIASDSLVSALELPEFIEPNPLGHVELRGKAEAMALVALA